MSVPAPGPPTAHRWKAAAGLLGLGLGFLGAHRLYLRARAWWVYPLLALPALGWALRTQEWYRTPAAFLAALVWAVAVVESIVFCLTPDAAWDARHNPASERRSASGWGPVLVAILAGALGAILVISVLAIAVETWMAARGR